MRHRHWLVLGILSIMLLVSGTALAAQKIVVIDATGNIEGTRRAAEAFTKKTGIEVEAIPTTWGEFETRIRTMIAGDQPFDVFRVDQARGYQSMALGFSMPLNQFIERDNFDVTAFPKPVIDYWAYEPTGDRYSIPYEVSSTVLWYSAKAMREAGMDRLPTQWNHPDLQWDRFVDTARKLTRDLDGDGVIDQYGLSYPSGWGWLYVGIWGQQWVDPFTNRFLGATPDLVDAITKWTNLALVDGVTPVPGTPAGTQQPPMFIGQTPGPMGTDPDMYELAVAPMPWGTQSAMQGGINGWAISKTSKNPQAAWEFIKFFTSEEGVLEWSTHRSGNAPVVHRDYYVDWTHQIMDRYSLTQDDVQAILEGSAYFWDVPILVSPAWTQVQPLFYGALQAIATGQKDAAQAMAEIEGAVNGLLDQQPFIWD